MGTLELNWESVHGGRLTVWHRPKVGALIPIARAGCTDVLTLLCEREGAPLVGEAVKKAGMVWHWLPMQNGTPPTGALHTRATQMLEQIAARLAGGASVLVHCSAGIHRTGMISYGLLRSLGFEAAEALASLGRMRTHTREGVHPEHLAWGDTVARPRPEAVTPVPAPVTPPAPQT
jgi:hypothetical protein